MRDLCRVFSIMMSMEAFEGVYNPRFEIASLTALTDE
jgi:hypothetical protein